MSDSSQAAALGDEIRVFQEKAIPRFRAKPSFITEKKTNQKKKQQEIAEEYYACEEEVDLLRALTGSGDLTGISN